MTDSGGWVNYYVALNEDPEVSANTLCGNFVEQCSIRGPSEGRYYFRVVAGENDGALKARVGYSDALETDEVVEITIAVDSDADFLGLFGGDAQAAVDHIAAIFNFAGPTWENELQLSVVVGDIFLHSTEPVPTLTLEGVRSHFESAHGESEHSAVHFLSTLNRFGGGVAFQDAMCSKEYGYAISGLEGFSLVSNGSTNWDPEVVAHELGHNFAAPHTHEFQNYYNVADPVDNCTGGFSETFLPGVNSLTGGSAGQGNGTIMSYCHLNEGGLDNIAFTYGDGHPFGIEANRVPRLMKDRLLDMAAAHAQCAPIVARQVDLTDSDGDGILDSDDFDRDGDGVKNDVDIAPDDASEWADYDGDGLFDNADDDDDNDGLSDDLDPLPFNADQTPFIQLTDTTISEWIGENYGLDLVGYLPTGGVSHLIDFANQYGGFPNDLFFSNGNFERTNSRGRRAGDWSLSNDGILLASTAKPITGNYNLTHNDWRNIDQSQLVLDENGEAWGEFELSETISYRFAFIEDQGSRKVAAYQEIRRLFLTGRDDLLMVPGAPIFENVSTGTHFYKDYLASKAAGEWVPFDPETVEAWPITVAIPGINRLSSNDGTCVIGNMGNGCGALVDFHEDGRFDVLNQSRSGDWTIDEDGRLVLNHDNSVVTTWITNLGDFEIGSGVNVYSAMEFDSSIDFYDNEIVSEYGLMVEAGEASLPPFLSKNLTSSFSLTDPQAPRLPDGDVLEGLFGFNLNDGGSGTNYLVGANYEFGLRTRDVSWFETETGLELSACYSFHQSGACYYQMRRTWDLLETTDSEIYVFETLYPQVDTDDDGAFDFFYDPQSRAQISTR